MRTLAGPLDVPRVMLTWDEVREMHALGMTIGSHTMTHPNLPNAGLAAASQELRASKCRLEQEIGAPVTMFSYPNGGAERYLTPEVQQAVREAGYAAATTSRNAFAQPGSDLYALERIEVEERLADLLFALEVERFAFAPAR
jgi:peptidoglycan/xylan/chitin deacetylase (PgdA/CDA1 family)